MPDCQSLHGYEHFNVRTLLFRKRYNTRVVILYAKITLALCVTKYHKRMTSVFSYVTHLFVC
jgi:hypothetical protein